jgi:3-oxoacyl-[acyl-carrier protein] reductase
MTTPPDPPPRDHGIPPPARTALVTGASRGIGRELALGLARAGVDVALLARDAGAVADVEEQVRDIGAESIAVPADVTDVRSVTRAVRVAQGALGPVDLLVNNAGRIEPVEVPPWEADPYQWRAVVETNLVGAFHLVRAIVPGMIERGGGRVIDLSSGAAVRDSPVYSAYHASKTALLRFGSGLHDAGHEQGLRSFEIAPGVVRTDMTAAMRVHSDRTEWTDPAAVVTLVVAVARGELDAWSGRFLRAGSDDLDTLRTVAARGLTDHARRLGVRPWGPEDPL